MNALRNAEKTPSVCNRRVGVPTGPRTRISRRRCSLTSVDSVNAQMPEVLLAITVSNNTFLSPVERNEAFVDGGLFAMSVMYGLEHGDLLPSP